MTTSIAMVYGSSILFFLENIFLDCITKNRMTRRRFGNGNFPSLLQMEGPYMMSSFGSRRQRRYSRARNRRFGSYGNFPNLVQMEGPYMMSSFGKRGRRRRYSNKKQKGRRRKSRSVKYWFGRRFGNGNFPSLLQMEGPYMANGFGRRRRMGGRRRSRY